MKIYRYYFVATEVSSLEDRLNELGKLGGEVVHFEREGYRCYALVRVEVLNEESMV